MESNKEEERRIEDISDELVERWEKMVVDADQNFGEVNVDLRWPQPEIDVIIRAATKEGISYKSHIRRAAFRQALADLNDNSTRIGVTSQGH